MGNRILEIDNLGVDAGDVPVLRGVNLAVGIGELHVLLGPNGSGKSSLLAAVMGLPPYRVTAGEIRFRGDCINDLRVDERARLGMGMAFQRPPSLDGVTVGDFREALNAASNYQQEATALDLDGFAGRHINVGFSGGEIKRWEVLKLFLQAPQLLLFDEPESGVDLEHIAAVGNAISRLLRTPTDSGDPRSALIITHTGFILDYVNADVGHVMIDGQIAGSGNPRELFQQIQRSGYGSVSFQNV